MLSGQYDEAALFLHAALKKKDQDHGAWYQLARVENHRRRFRAALTAVERSLALDGGNLAYRRLRGIILSNLRAYAEAIEVLTPVVAAHPDDVSALNSLQTAHYHAGNRDQAIALGTTILGVQDRAAKLVPDPQPSKHSRIAKTVPKKWVIAFSLWGAHPGYNYGAMINARLAHFIYPGWTCRFYLGADVPALTVRMLEQAGAEIVQAAKNHGDVPPAVWRFLAADDPEVAVFLCRDCDARLSPKEAAAVDAWLRSGRSFHLMRDNVVHRSVILAGLWGGRTNSRLHISDRIKRFFDKGADRRYGTDQDFLAMEIWPAIRSNCLVHDSYYSLFDAQPFPVLGKGVDRNHVGMGIMGEDVVRKEAALFGLPWPITA